MSDAPFPPARGEALRQVVAGVVFLLLAGSILLGSFWLAESERLVGRPPGVPVGQVTPSPSPLAVTSPGATVLPLTETPVIPSPTFSPTPLSATPTFRSLLYPACPAPSGWRPYWIRVGDTLTSLAWRAGTSSFTLMEVNCLEGEALQPGRILYLPPSFFATPTAVPCGAPAGWILYTVQRGDTLYNLASRLGITIESIRRANCMSGYTIYVGKPLYLPARPPTPTRTPTSIPTATATVFPTMTATPSPFPTGTLTPLPSPSATFTPSPTLTWTPVPTATTPVTPTATPTPTFTPTATGTPTPTFTPTPSPTPTSTPTAPPEQTPTPTETPEASL